MSIGEFAKLTHLSVKTLRHYHDMHLLAPATVDPNNGYRYYAHSQAHRAHLVRRLREADMSLAEIAALLGGADSSDRRARVSAHADDLASRARELAATAEALQASLEAEVGALDIGRRELIPVPALVLTGSSGLDTVGAFCGLAFERLDKAARAVNVSTVGPGVASFDDAVFESEGTVSCAVAIRSIPPAIDRLESDIVVGETPGGVFLTAVHCGDRRHVGVTYSSLGAHVDDLGVGASQPVVECYLVADGNPADFRTDICWPVIS